VNRSALVREALREYLKRLETRELEARDRTGYEEHRDVSTEAPDSERVAAWPERLHTEKSASINSPARTRRARWRT
jgi:metal-responsive CopG/Arc/MetJ family transcriptional regulator